MFCCHLFSPRFSACRQCQSCTSCQRKEDALGGFLGPWRAWRGGRTPRVTRSLQAAAVWVSCAIWTLCSGLISSVLRANSGLSVQNWVRKKQQEQVERQKSRENKDRKPDPCLWPKGTASSDWIWSTLLTCGYIPEISTLSLWDMLVFVIFCLEKEWQEFSCTEEKVFHSHYFL